MNGVASWHGRTVLAEIVRYQPDAIIVQVGHSDWITPPPDAVNPLMRAAAQLRFYQLAVVAGQKMQRGPHGPLNVARIHSRAEPYGRARDRARGTETLTAREREWIIARYADNLRAIVAAGRAAGATVILDALPQNLSDFPPGASRHRRGISEDERMRWREAVERADARMRAQDWQGALEALQTAERIDKDPAILHYLRGRCLEEIGDFAAAAAEYRLASDLDGAPLGAPSVVDGVIRNVAEETGAQFVDVSTALALSSPNGLVGDRFFFDYVHPSVAGHAAIARVFAEAMGAPGGDDHATDPATLTAANPELQRKAYAADTLLYLQLGWYDRAVAELSDASQRYPELLGVRDLVEKLRAGDPVKQWDDFPAAPD
jgi:tetratricopeptide (TPR) repeat protein